MPKLLPRLLAVAAAGAAAVLAVPGTAQALPEQCSYTIDQYARTASSFCASGTGEHRIWVKQCHFLPEVGCSIVMWGEWKPAGQVSSTYISAHTIREVQIHRR
ncbi:hypothetical protein [Longispora albida]|uniref:hypothetical protein n=1 Tax=Longispora albida TaxID=203523 RepID=UPI00036D5412|nr:hypothetical protein [Longispora albida]